MSLTKKHPSRPIISLNPLKPRGLPNSPVLSICPISSFRIMMRSEAMSSCVCAGIAKFDSSQQGSPIAIYSALLHISVLLLSPFQSECGKFLLQSSCFLLIILMTCSNSYRATVLFYAPLAFASDTHPSMNVVSFIVYMLTGQAVAFI